MRTDFEVTSTIPCNNGAFREWAFQGLQSLFRLYFVCFLTVLASLLTRFFLCVSSTHNYWILFLILVVPVIHVLNKFNFYSGWRRILYKGIFICTEKCNKECYVYYNATIPFHKHVKNAERVNLIDLFAAWF